MSSSTGWPPELKAWVQQCLSRATASNKDAVNAELKQILFQSHKDGTIASTDWTKVELASLRAQAQRTTHTPIPPRFNITTTTTTTAFAPPSEPPAEASKKKRKKKDGTATATAAKSFPSPYHFTSSAEEAAALARRAARFQQPQAASSSSLATTATTTSGVGKWFEDDTGDLSMGSSAAGGAGAGVGMVPGQVGKRKMRGKGVLGYTGEEVMEVDPNVIDWDKHTIRGTSTKLEKSYLRLTSEPSPADIRPLQVLQQTLQLLKSKWKQNHNYAYALDQFKSMRQDLTVQRIKNEFTVEVYEIHGRIALEAKDLGEYNQCQTMLRQLYELGLKGHPQEFLSYRIMYLLHTRNRSDMASLLAQLTPGEKADPGVRHSLDVHASLATSNYVRFFRLFSSAPNMSGYIMDHFVERERISALAIMSKAYPTLTLAYITSTLAFDALEETDDFLSKHDAAIYTNLHPPAPLASQSSTTGAAERAFSWRPLKPAVAAPTPLPLPLADRIWDCKRAHQACARGISKYRVVDLKGQVD